MVKTVLMEVKPFKAFRFNADVVGDAGACIAPPYDVINEDERDELYRKSRYNIVRITKGKTTSCDDGQHNPYTRAAEFLQMWIAAGVLKQDDEETIYGYVQDFELDGTTFQRVSFIALGKLEDFGKTVRPHEQVFEKPMLDRLNLERATAARFGLVFMLYDDPQDIVENIVAEAMTQARGQGLKGGDSLPSEDARHSPPALIDFVDEQDVRHRLYAITAERDADAIISMMREKSCIIADGHHRYTTGLTYMRESGNPAARYQMIAFTNTHQKGLVVLATHRLVGGVDGFAPEEFRARLQGSFDIASFRFGAAARAKEQARQKMLARMKSLHGQGKTVLGVYMADGAFYTAVLKDAPAMAAAAPDKSDAWRTLDVAVLQRLVLERLLGFDEEKMGNAAYVEYIKDLPNAMQAMIEGVDAGRRQLAFFTNPVKMEQLAQVTEAGERMPHKSTYFYPKMYTGLTIQKL